MSYLPLNKPLGSKDTIRNRGWHWYEDGSNGVDSFGSEYRHRYLAPCPSVTDDDGVYRHDCSSLYSATPEVDACGKPFRVGADFAVETATGLGATPCGGRRNR